MKVHILLILILTLPSCSIMNQIDSYPAGVTKEYPTGLYISYYEYRVFSIADRREKSVNMIKWFDDGSGLIAGLNKADIVLRYANTTFNLNKISENDIEKMVQSSGYYERSLRKNKKNNQYRIIKPINSRWTLYFFFEDRQFIGFKITIDSQDCRTNILSDADISFITNDSILTFPFNPQDAIDFFKQMPTKTEIKYQNKVI